MGDTLDFPAFPGQPELDGMDRAQLLSCLERIQLVLEQLGELEPRIWTAMPMRTGENATRHWRIWPTSSRTAWTSWNKAERRAAARRSALSQPLRPAGYCVP